MPKSDLLLERYLEQCTSPPSEALLWLERQTHLQTLAPQMLSGRVQGRFLSLISRLHRPRTVLEIGTFTGYAAICLAEGLQPGGALHTVELNPELLPLITAGIDKAGMQEHIHVHIGDALEVIPTLDFDFDLVFIDAGKSLYQRFYDLVIDRVRSGGLILADNTLWSGKVLYDSEDAETRALQAFNQSIQADDRVENVLLPIRDGILICQKR